MREPRWLPRLVVDAVHLDQIREHGGLPGLRDENGLDAALHRAQQKWRYDKQITLPALAAAYGFAISTTHPFNDGNKRIAFLAIAIFLGMNGKELNATEAEVVQVMIALASGKLDEAELATWIGDHMVRMKPESR